MPGADPYTSFVQTLTADNSPVGRILATLALPIEYDPIRFEGTGTSLKSAITKVKEELDFNWMIPSGGSASGILPDPEFQIFLFRALACYMRYPFKQYPGSFVTIQYTSQALNPCPQGMITECTNLPLGFDATASSSGAPQPCGPAIYPGKASGRFGYWLDQIDDTVSSGRVQAIRITLDTTPAANDSGYFAIKYWNGYFWQAAGTIAFLSTAAAYDIANPGLAGPGWYSVDIVNISQNAAGPVTQSGVTSYTVAYRTNRSFWAQRAAPQLADYATFIEEHRIMAVAGLWQNNSPELDLSGKVNSITVPKGVPFSAFIGGASEITTSAGFKALDAKLGAYTFLKPDDDEDFRYNDQISSLAQVQSLNLPTIWYPIRNTAPYEVINMSVVAPLGRDTTLTTAIHFEYLTLNQLPSLGAPMFTQNDWETALRLLRKMDNHQNNAVHFENLVKSILRAAPVLWRATKAITGAIPTVPTQIIHEGMERVEDMVGSSKELMQIIAQLTKKRRR